MNISFPKINSISMQNFNNNKVAFRGNFEDRFEKSSDSKMRESLAFAKEYCMESVRCDSPKERSVAIDSIGNILYKNDGEERSCKVEFDKLVPNTTIIHSHPGEKFKPLSPGDVITFLSTPEIKTMIAIGKNGDMCSMTKPDHYYFGSMDRSIIRNKIDEIFMKNWLDVSGISYELDDNYVSYYENKLKEKIGISSEDKNALYQNLFSMDRPQDPKDAIKMIEFQCMYSGITVLKPYMHAFLLNDRVPDDSDLGIEIQKKFNEKIADIYGLELNFS